MIWKETIVTKLKILPYTAKTKEKLLVIIQYIAATNLNY
jgi:hypothetical protein